MPKIKLIQDDEDASGEENSRVLQRSNQVYGRLLRTGRLSKKEIAFFDSKLSFARLFSEDRLSKAAFRHIHAKQMRNVITLPSNNYENVGQHVLGEFTFDKSLKYHGVEVNASFWRKLLLFAAMKAGATILTSHFMDTVNGGTSAVVVIAESHFIIHYMPAKKYLALDIYTCGEMNTNLALDYIIKELDLAPYDTINFKRGISIGRRFSKTDPRNSLVPGIASEITSTPEITSTLRFFHATSNSTSSQQRNPIAHHCVGELYCSDPRIINKDDRLLQAFNEAFDIDFEYSYTKQFKPQGVSLVLMSSKGVHATTHPWPELIENYTPVDIFVSAESGIDARAAMERLAGILLCQRFTINEFPRGVRGESGALTPVLNELLPTTGNSTSFRK